MSHTTKGSDKMLSKDQIGSPSTDEGSSGGSMVGGGRGSGLKKGPWTSAEDAILVEYVKKHGEGNWNAVQKHSGLSRCGKSCRLRWANHLRPNLKKGAFTQEEENIIIELHDRMGNKWARMATHLPGRTDNEIKNYWNTRIKRRQRASLPVYPPNLSSPSSENHHGQNFGDISSGAKMQYEAMLGTSYDMPDFAFNGYNVSHGPPFSEIPVNNMLSQGFGSQNYGFISQSLDHKWLGLHETLYPVYPPSMGSGLPLFENFSNDPSEKTRATLGQTSYPYDPDPYEGSIPGSHAVLMNGNNFSTSSSFLGTVKSELPSLQYTETVSPSSWFETDAVDTYIQSPPALSTQSECSSLQNSGLLEEVLHESQALHTGKKQFPDKSSNSSAMTPSDLMDSEANNFYDETALEEECDPISPLGCSATSAFNEFTPPISGSSGLSIPNTAEMDVKPKLLRPDSLLGSSWLFESSQIKDHSEMNNAMAAFLGDGCSSDHMPVIAGTSSPFSGGLGLDSFRWNNMSRLSNV